MVPGWQIRRAVVAGWSACYSRPRNMTQQGMRMNVDFSPLSDDDVTVQTTQRPSPGPPPHHSTKMDVMKVKKICCIGAGYVGGPTMAVRASLP